MDIDAELEELETKFKKEKQVPKKTKTCRICEKEYPADRDHFYSAPTCKDGLDTRCKGCVRKINLAAAETQPEEKAIEDVGPETRVIQVDFTGHDALLERLEKLAYSEFRTPELQLLALIAKEA